MMAITTRSSISVNPKPLGTRHRLLQQTGRMDGGDKGPERPAGRGGKRALRDQLDLDGIVPALTSTMRSSGVFPGSFRAGSGDPTETLCLPTTGAVLLDVGVQVKGPVRLHLAGGGLSGLLVLVVLEGPARTSRSRTAPAALRRSPSLDLPGRPRVFLVAATECEGGPWSVRALKNHFDENPPPRKRSARSTTGNGSARVRLRAVGQRRQRTPGSLETMW